MTKEVTPVSFAFYWRMFSAIQSKLNPSILIWSKQNHVWQMFDIWLIWGLHWQIYSTFSFDSCSANTQNTNVIMLKINLISEHTVFSSSAHTIHNTLFWLRVKKNCTETGVDQTTHQRWTENVLKMKAKYNAKGSSLIYNTSAKHERHECYTNDTSTKPVLHERHECDTNEKFWFW